MKKPLIYDCFCGAGGAAMGYHRAGFEVVGIDLHDQPRYPFTFIKMDALEFLERYLAGEFPKADAFHASPPCQGYSLLSFAPNRNMDKYPKLVEDVRDLFQKIGKPYVIENVVNAPLRNPLLLCGTMFGLKTHKHRNFESKPDIWFPPSMCNKARVKPKGSTKKWGNTTQWILQWLLWRVMSLVERRAALPWALIG